jgi:dTDP-4-dehydrorhamnose reductase
MRILITGASGLLGVNLAMEFAGDARHKPHTVIGVTNTHPLRTSSFETLVVDLTAPGAVERLLETAHPDWVINCAALAVIDACETQPRLAHALNVELPEKLAKHVARGGARLVHISTDSVFNGQRGGYSEDDQPDPQTVYSRTKLEGEQRVLDNDPEAVVARVNLVGWSLTGKRSLAEFFFYNLQAGRQVNGFTDVYFCPLLANNLGEILLKMLEKRLTGLYHATSRDMLNKYEFGVRLAERFGFDPRLVVPVSVEEGGLLAKRSRDLSMRVDKIERDLGEEMPVVQDSVEGLWKLDRSGYRERLLGFA